MNNFKIGPEISEFESVADFVKVFNISQNDYIFTEKIFYDSYLSNLNANFIFYDDYGFGEPKNTTIDLILKDIEHLNINRLIGIGGGTILDTAKILSMKNPGNVSQVFNDLVPHEREMELILIPTTCGTGCEVTSVSVVDIVEEQTKIGKRIECNFADHAVLISELLDNIPKKIFAYSSIDALIHALEILVAPTSNPYNDMFCKEAIKIILEKYKKIDEQGIEARFEYIDEFLRASTLAGVALSNTTCGAVHAIAMHFGSRYKVPHGEANALFLVNVFEKYVEKSEKGKIQEVTDCINLVYNTNFTTKEAIDKLDGLINSIIELNSLESYGVEKEHIEENVDKVINSQQRLLINNYVHLSREDLVDIYNNAFERKCKVVKPNE
jgi:4-hydroxybutyrate dehydrogenase